MRRMITTVAAATLVLAACGGGDDSAEDVAAEPATSDTETQTSSTDAETEASSPEPDVAPEPAENSGEDVTSDDEPADDDPVESDASGGGSIRSIDDVPPRCRDLMAEFLADIEPIVEQVDWQTATAQDFEQIAPEFEQLADTFDTDAAAEDCDDLDLGEDAGFELVIEFADDVAPGTVPFFEFLDDMLAAFPTNGDDSDSAGETADSDSIETCDQMIDGLRDLMDQYDSFDEMPLSELTKYAGIGTIMMTCTPEQLELLGSDEFEAFLGG